MLPGCQTMTLTEIRAHDAYRNRERGQVNASGKLLSRCTKRELCEYFDDNTRTCTEKTMREIRTTTQYRAVPRGTRMDGGRTKSRARKAGLCEYLESSLRQVALGESSVAGVQAVPIVATPGGDQLVALYINRTRAHGGPVMTQLVHALSADDGPSSRHPCGILDGYSRFKYGSAPTGQEWAIIMVIVPAPPSTDAVTIVASTLLLERGRAVELDVVCGTKARTPLIRAVLGALHTRHERIDLTGDGARAVQGGRDEGRLALGSMVVCMAIRWALRLRPRATRVFLKSVPEQVSRYGTFGFLPHGPSAEIRPRDVVQFGRDTYGDLATLESRRRAQTTALDTWASDSDGLYHMEMTKRRTRVVLSERCNGDMGMDTLGINPPL